MFGGLKKKLQEAISRVVAPKKEEVEQEIKKEEIRQDENKLKEQAQELKIHEQEIRERIETRRLEEPEERAEKLDKSIEAKQEIEEDLTKKIEAEISKAPEDDISELAKAEFEKISKEMPALEKKEIEKTIEYEKIRFEAEKKIIIEDKAKPIEKKETIETILKQKPKDEEKTESFLKAEKSISTPALREIEKEAEPAKEKTGLIKGIVKRIAEKKLEEKDIYEIIHNLQIALLENDTALEVAEKICDQVQASLVGKSVKRGNVSSIIRESLRSAMLDVMRQETIDIEKLLAERDRPLLVMFLGFNGTGKTTTLAKFAYKFKSYNPVLAAGDTFRAASIEQLQEHGSRIGVEVIKHSYGADSAAVIFDAMKHAAADNSKLVLADTAGRSHSNVNLMDELKKVVRVNKPDLKILVLDSMTGNDIYDQAKLFNDAVGIDGIILTKGDVYDKGGAALSAAYTIKKPILFMGTGQEYGDLKEFRPEEAVKNLLD
jgi:fused signal recognition particle receptor